MVGISLNNSMRQTLLSLQNTARLQDLTSNRLATGLKVNSALDNPSSFYTARSLTNRAADLNALLDAMSQGIQTLKATSETIDTAANFLQQAKAVANQAFETKEKIVAKVSTEQELLDAIDSGETGLIVIDGIINMTSNTEITLKDGQSLVGQSYFQGYTQSSGLNFVTDDNTNRNAIIVGNNSVISNLNITLETNTNSSETGVIYAAGKSNVQINNVTIDVKNTSSSNNSGIWLAGILGTDNSQITLKGNINISTEGIRVPGVVAQKNSTLDIHANLNIKTNGEYGVGIWTIWDSFTTIHQDAKLNIEIKGNNSSPLANGTNRNGKTVIKSGAELNFHTIDRAFWNEATASTFIIESNVKISNLSTGGINKTWMSTSEWVYDIFESVNNLDDYAAYFVATGAAEALPPLADIDISSVNSYKEKADQYNAIIDQYNSVIADGSYKGINLLNNQDLKINFNEDRSSFLNISGVDASSQALGISIADWSAAGSISKNITELERAVNQLRSFASQFGTYNNILTIRQDFTEAMINVLEEGADRLTLADMTQESANMLALQTRQQLAVNALSLASQASQSVLKLF